MTTACGRGRVEHPPPCCRDFSPLDGRLRRGAEDVTVSHLEHRRLDNCTGRPLRPIREHEIDVEPIADGHAYGHHADRIHGNGADSASLNRPCELTRLNKAQAEEPPSVGRPRARRGSATRRAARRDRGVALFARSPHSALEYACRRRRRIGGASDRKSRTRVGAVFSHGGMLRRAISLMCSDDNGALRAVERETTWSWTGYDEKLQSRCGARSTARALQAREVSRPRAARRLLPFCLRWLQD